MDRCPERNGVLAIQKGKTVPEKIKCREGVFDGDKVVTVVGNLNLDAADCFCVRSVRSAKKEYAEAVRRNIEAEKEPLATKTAKETIVSAEKPLHAVAYTDGSYNKDTGRYGYGVLLEIGGEKHEYFGGAPDTTGGWQVNGEIQAVLVAIKKAIEAGCVSVCIYYDYEGVHKWADGLWRAKKSYTSDYKDKVQEYRKKIDISFEHIKSHTGNPGNERADDLAKMGAELTPISNGSADMRINTTEIAGDGQVFEDVNTGQKIGEHVNPQCRKALQAFWKKPKHNFKDFMNLKTYGMDAYSKVRTAELKKYAEQHSLDLSDIPDEYSQMTAIRWVMRGLSVDDAIHKVKVDAEVRDNARGRWMTE